MQLLQLPLENCVKCGQMTQQHVQRHGMKGWLCVLPALTDCGECGSGGLYFHSRYLCLLFICSLNHSGSLLWGWNNITSDLLTVLQFPRSQNMVERPDLTLFLATQTAPTGRKSRRPLKNIIINNGILRFGGVSVEPEHRLSISGWLQLLSWFHTSYLLSFRHCTVRLRSPFTST